MSSSRSERKMGALTTALIAIAGLVLGWAAIEMACRPCLQSGRSALDKSLNPDYDPDDDLDTAPARRRREEENEENDAGEGSIEGLGGANEEDDEGDDEKKKLNKKKKSLE